MKFKPSLLLSDLNVPNINATFSNDISMTNFVKKTNLSCKTNQNDVFQKHGELVISSSFNVHDVFRTSTMKKKKKKIIFNLML